MLHELRFTRPTPGAHKEADGYRLRWRGAALMGIVNITPDSFSDAGRHFDTGTAIAHARRMIETGAMFIDIGGESTRPGAEPVPTELELDRVLPVIRSLRADTTALISIDSYKPEVASEALAAGAHIVNDVTGLRDERMQALCAERGVPAVIMHMQGEPRTMQKHPSYQDVAGEVYGYLTQQAERALAAGVPSVILDPGIGFGKTLEHNLTLLRELPRLVNAGHPVLVGASRKKSLGMLTGVEQAGERDPASIAAHLHSERQGAAILRVHNVPAHAQALKVWEALHG